MTKFGTPRVLTRAYFSTYHLWAAQHFADECQVIEETHSGDPKFDIRHRALAMATVIESGAFLESVINELFKDCADGHASYTSSLSNSAFLALKSQWNDWHASRRITKPTLDKFDAAISCCGVSPFSRGTAPYQDADLVLSLRNALVHFTPQWAAADEPNKFDNLKSKFKPNALMEGSGNAYFPDKCLGAGSSRWAIEVVENFAGDFFSRIGVTPNYMRLNSPPSVPAS
jgi:hypothetical protein